jgi:holo-[acyl-carrier protein] synthase
MSKKSKIATKMIKGIGTDIIEISRIQKAYLRFGNQFLQRILTPAEQNYCRAYHEPAPHLAGRFSAKEAVAKALGTGFGSRLSWLDVEIINDSHGRPQVRLSQHALTAFENPLMIVSISHCREYATATALWITKL